MVREGIGRCLCFGKPRPQSPVGERHSQDPDARQARQLTPLSSQKGQELGQEQQLATQLQATTSAAAPTASPFASQAQSVPSTDGSQWKSEARRHKQRSVEPTRPPAPRPVDDDERIRTVEQLGVLQTSRDDPHRDAIVMLESTNSQAQEVVDFNSRIQCSQFGGADVMPNAGKALRIEEHLQGLAVSIQLETESDARVMLYDLVSKLFDDAPLACFCLMGTDMLWLKSAQPFPFVFVQHNYVFPRGIGMIDWVLLPECKQVLVVDHLLTDIRFRDDDMVKLVSWGASTPLIASNGQRIGALGVFHKDKQCNFSSRHYATLTHLAELAVREFERDAIIMPDAPEHRNLVKEARRTHRAVGDFGAESDDRPYHVLEALGPLSARTLTTLQQGVMLCDAGQPGWPVVYVSTQWCRLLGLPPHTAVGRRLWDVFEVPGETGEQSQALTEKQAERQARPFQGRPFPIAASEPMTNQWVTLEVHCASMVSLANDFPLQGIPTGNIIEQGPNDSGPNFYTVMVSLDTMHTGSVDITGYLQRSLSTSYERSRGADRVFNEVKLRGVLGKGASSSVFRAVWRNLDVAVKVIEWQHVGPKGAEQSALVKEGVVAVMLNHPNIVRTFDFGIRKRRQPNAGRALQPTKTEEEELDVGVAASPKPEEEHGQEADKAVAMEAWVLMELCNKGNLQDANDRGWLRPSSALREQEGAPPDMVATLTTAVEISKAMAHLHSLGLVHRDLTTGNVLLYPEPTDPRGWIAKVTDFGMAANTSNPASNALTTGAGVSHLAPERLMGSQHTPAADVFAFGVLLWSIYTAKVPWSKCTRAQIAVEVAVQKKSLQLPPGTPPDFKAVTASCLAHDIDSRPTFAQLITTLQAMLERYKRNNPPSRASSQTLSAEV